MQEVKQAEPRGWKRAFINAFVILHLYVIIFWGMPPSPFRNMMVQPVQPYVIKTGLWHSWDMFSPDPLAINFNVEAHITYEDGSIRIWEFPRMEKYGVWKRYFMERHRKWRERVRQDSYGVVWEDTCRYIARMNNTPTNAPKQIVLVRHWGPISPPATESPASSKVKDYQPIPEHYDMKFNYRFAYYTVKPGDL